MAVRFVTAVFLLALTVLLSGPAHAACVSPTGVEGQMVYNTSSHVLQYCNGTSWTAMGKAGTTSVSCTSPAGPEGSIVYNSNYHTYQFCNGTTWAAFTSGPLTCANCNILGTTVPAMVDSGDGAAVNLAMIFYSEVPGRVTGVRFYKASTNTGTHIGVLWDQAGNNLAQVTFTGETASGWQSMNFSSPIFITANTYYIISYYAPSGHYSDGSVAQDFGTEIVSGPLHAIQDGFSSYANGLFAYNTGVMFPNNTYQSSNYFVDVIFSSP